MRLPPPVFPSEKWSSDSAYIAARSMTSAFGLGSLLGPPVYVCLLLSKRTRILSVERFFNVTTCTGLGVAGAGGGASYTRSYFTDPQKLKQKRVELAYSVSRRREDDFTTIGLLLGGCLAPAVFWTRAGLLDLTLGGITLGYGGGYLTHHVKTYMGDVAGKAPEPEIPTDDPRMRRR
ncbi:hypothetical protein C8J57DRAFT_1286559 [Mycena rebaudengoi]|nr:hypothetical protein C8J57DRAFT_1286559 [Mycena rebaudengoi]